MVYPAELRCVPSLQCRTKWLHVSGATFQHQLEAGRRSTKHAPGAPYELLHNRFGHQPLMTPALNGHVPTRRAFDRSHSAPSPRKRFDTVTSLPPGRGKAAQQGPLKSKESNDIPTKPTNDDLKRATVQPRCLSLLLNTGSPRSAQPRSTLPRAAA